MRASHQEAADLADIYRSLGHAKKHVRIDIAADAPGRMVA
jgi:hypothetical protein